MRRCEPATAHQERRRLALGEERGREFICSCQRQARECMKSIGRYSQRTWASQRNRSAEKPAPISQLFAEANVRVHRDSGKDVHHVSHLGPKVPHDAGKAVAKIGTIRHRG